MNPVDAERVYALRGLPKPEQIKAFAEVWADAPGKDELAKLLGLATLMGGRAAAVESSADAAYDREYGDLLADLVACFKRAGGKVQRAGLDRKLYAAWAEAFERRARLK